MRILIYTFSNFYKSTYKALKQFETTRTESANQIELFYIYRNFNLLLQNIKTEKYDAILGIADYKVNAINLRIENMFVNKYGKKLILIHGKDKYESSLQIDFTKFKQNKIPYSIPTTTSNGPCNKSAYLISRLIDESKLNTKFGFIHIPRKYKVNEIVIMIEFIIKSLNAKNTL